MKKRKFKNIESYEETSRWLKNNFSCPIFDEDGQLTEDYEKNYRTEIILDVIDLLEDAKNAAVRAAIHRVLIGNAMIDYREEDDGEPYYVEDEYGNINYLGRGVLTIASFRPAKNGTYFDYTIGDCVIEHRTPLD